MIIPALLMFAAVAVLIYLMGAMVEATRSEEATR